MKLYKYIAIVGFMLIGFSTLKAQETTFYAEKNRHLKKGLNLVNQELYAPALKEFQWLKEEMQHSTDNHQYTYLMYADFYAALCAARLNNPDAELLFTRFIEAYHHTSLRNQGYFELGNYYFNQNNTNEAIKWYEKVDTKQLPKEDVTQYKFNYGYVNFKRKKFDAAKPLFKAVKDGSSKYAEPATYYYGFISFYDEDYGEAEKSFEKLTNSDTYKNVVPYYLTQIYFLRGNYDKVITYATPLINDKDNKNSQEIKHIVGQAYFEKQDYENAAPLIDAYISSADKVSKEEMYQLAFAQYKTGQYKKALENFKDLSIVDDSLGQNALYCLGDCYLKTNQKDKAKDALQQASNMDYDPLIKEVATFESGKLAYELNFTSQAINKLTSFINKYPKSVYKNEAGKILGEALLATKNFSKAIEIIEEYNITGPNVDKVYQQVSYYRAVELFNDKEYDLSLATVNKSLKKNIDDDITALATFLKGNLLFEKEDYANAAKNYFAFKNYRSSNAENKFASKALADYNIAYCYFKEEDYAPASTYFEKSILNANSLNLTNKQIIPDAFLRNADCLFMTKNYDKAIHNYDEIINNNWQGAAYALVQKSVINGLQGNQVEKINTLEFLNRTYPNNIYQDYSFFEIGNAYIAESNLNKATITLNKLINEFPSSTYVPKAYLKLGLSYFNMQQEEKALKAYKDVVLKFPKTDEAQEALLALKELYVYLGRPDDYLDFVQNQAGINLSTTEQDQLMFESAENQYINGNCTDAIPSLTKYINKFPKGNNILNAHYFRADCLFKGNDFQNAYFDYIRINEFGANKYQEEALLKATYIAYEKNKDYAGALSLYKQLYKVATVQSNQEIALIGMLRSNYKLKNYNKVLDDADKVLNNNSINTDVKTEATFYKAKAHFELQQYNLAKSGFEQIVNTVSNSAIKAESAYSLAYILYKNGQYEQSNTACFKIKDEYASYEYWVVKTFILIADNYQALDNIFQTKATLQSIVDNYKGDETLLNEAKTKLEKLKQLEIENSKLDLNPQEQDTIQFDNK